MRECTHKNKQTECPNAAFNCKNRLSGCVFLKFDSFCSYDKCFEDYKRILWAECKKRS